MSKFICLLLLIIYYIVILYSATSKIIDYIQLQAMSLGGSNIEQLEVDPCDLSAERQANTLVDIGYQQRQYYGLTNDYSQLSAVYAKQLELQEETELSNNDRYCADEAKVIGTEQADYDQGHVIADSLGGVSNAYNITPENSYVNRFGTQSRIEQQLRDALNQGRIVSDFYVQIIYPNHQTMIPVLYRFWYSVDGKKYENFFFNYSFHHLN